MDYSTSIMLEDVEQGAVEDDHDSDHENDGEQEPLHWQERWYLETDTPARLYMSIVIRIVALMYTSLLHSVYLSILGAKDGRFVMLVFVTWYDLLMFWVILMGYVILYPLINSILLDVRWIITGAGQRGYMSRKECIRLLYYNHMLPILLSGYNFI